MEHKKFCGTLHEKTKNKPKRPKNLKKPNKQQNVF